MREVAVLYILFAWINFSRSTYYGRYLRNSKKGYGMSNNAGELYAILKAIEGIDVR